MKVSLEECIKRDSERDSSVQVGESVIRRMYNTYLYPKHKLTDNRKILVQDEKLPKCVIVDIDGTLALMNDRNPFDYNAAINDFPNQNMITILNNLKEDIEIIIVSGREKYSLGTLTNWLNKHKVPYSQIFMRNTADHRPDDIVKKEIYEAHFLNKYNIVAVFDDRDKVVRMWRDIGLLCLQVYYGDF